MTAEPSNASSPTSKSSSPTTASNTRRHLPATRHSITHKFTTCGHEMYVTVGFFEDGSPGEVFVKGGKHGSEVSGLLDGWAVAVSVALQYGVPWQTIEAKALHTRFGNPDTMPGGDSSMLHGIAKAISFVLGAAVFATVVETETTTYDENGEARRDFVREVIAKQGDSQ